MLHDRVIQAVAAAVTIGAATAGGMLLPSVLRTSEAYAMRYTDTSIEGAPAIVALGNSIGALRGLIVDYLWLKVHIAKQRGLFYEVMADADLITKLQPRFAGVWAFHGHNMAYNISVMTHTEAERWEWVQAGINLVRTQGLKYNPNDLELHKEMAFWFGHKIEGVNDDAHLYYKREFCRKWHEILGQPPITWADRTAWIEAIANAPNSLAEAETRTSGVAALVDLIRTDLGEFRQDFRGGDLGDEFLRAYSQWDAIMNTSNYAKILGAEQTRRARSPYFVVFDRLASNPDYAAAWETLLLTVRKRVLVEDMNMDPQLMYEYTRDYGPFDWRHGATHQFYWSRKGAGGEARIAEDDIFLVLNNDRLQIQAMQLLFRSGDIRFDPLSDDRPSRLPQVHWIEAIDEYFEMLYVKHYDVQGAGGDTFIDFHINFMKDAIRLLARQGERAAAERLLAKLDELYGSKGLVPNREYLRSLDAFVRAEVIGEYEMQPHMAPTDVIAALRYGIQVGIGKNRPEVFNASVNFAAKVREHFRGNDYNNYVTKFGEGRIKDIIGALDTSLITAYEQLMTDPGVPMIDRISIYQVTPDDVKAMIYDKVKPTMVGQLQRSDLRNLDVNRLLPEPEGLDEVRQKRAIRDAEKRERDETTAAIERRGGG